MRTQKKRKLLLGVIEETERERGEGEWVGREGKKMRERECVQTFSHV